MLKVLTNRNERETKMEKRGWYRGWEKWGESRWEGWGEGIDGTTGSVSFIVLQTKQTQTAVNIQ